jgi:hypothetical protein
VSAGDLAGALELEPISSKQWPGQVTSTPSGTRPLGVLLLLIWPRVQSAAASRIAA